MAGRLGRDEEGRVQIDCNAKGVLFVEAESDSMIDDFGYFRPSLELRRLVPAIDYSGDLSMNHLFISQDVNCLAILSLADGIASMHLELISVDGDMSNEMNRQNSLVLNLCNVLYNYHLIFIDQSTSKY